MFGSYKRRLSVEALESRLVLSGVSAVMGPAALQGYIVVLNDNVADVRAAAQALVPAGTGQVGFIYEHAIRGFSVQLPEAAAAALGANPQVKFVEPDGIAHTLAQEVPTGISRIGTTANINGTTSPLYVSDQPGNPVDVAIIDTGIDVNHPDLKDFIAGGAYAQQSGGPPWARSVSMVTDPAKYNDGNGHGTHVAGTVGAIDNGLGVVGVAPGVQLWAVKVLEDNGSGTYAQVIAGMDWVTERAGQIEVANMSLGGSFSGAVNEALRGMVNAGIFVAVAAGNSSANAMNFSPASEPLAFTVSAMVDTDGTSGGLGPATTYGADDTLASFSNYGSVIDAAAPGVLIKSTWKGGGYNTISGTSMASPHAAGVAALYIAANGRAMDATGVTAIRDALVAAGQPMTDWRADNADVASDPDVYHEPMVYGGSFELPEATTPPPEEPGGDEEVAEATIYIEDITGSSQTKGKSGKPWEAFATVQIASTGGTGVTVHGTWSHNASTSSGVTTDGKVTFASGGVNNNIDAVTFTVTNVVPPDSSLVYDENGNVKTGITINKDGTSSSVAIGGTIVAAASAPAAPLPLVEVTQDVGGRPEGVPPFGAPPLETPPVAVPPFETPRAGAGRPEGVPPPDRPPVATPPVETGRDEMELNSPLVQAAVDSALKDFAFLDDLLYSARGLARARLLA